MDLSLFFAKFLGLYLVIFAIGVFANFKFYYRAIDNFLDNSFFAIVSGIISLLLGLVLVLLHNRWTSDWTLIITLLGWVIFIGGIIRLWFPQHVIEGARAMRDSKGWPVMIALFGVIGLFLLYHGFYPSLFPLTQ